MSIGPLTQIYEIARNETSANVSLLNFIILGVGCAAWGVWGVWSKNKPLVVANVVGTIAYIATVAVIVIYR
jgi:uncharacterized protein with PQ loop repeat